MSIRGIVPKIDHAVFADTGWEPPAVYEHLDWLTAEAAAAGIPVHRVAKGSIRADYLASRSPDATGRFVSLPLFLKNADGSTGLLRRQCTREYKIEPIHRFIRTHVLGLRPRQHAPKGHVIDQWFGITIDEVQRMRISPEPWKRNVYPFCGRHGHSDVLPRPYTRQDCLDWLSEHYPKRRVPRSACIGCPFHANEEWERMKREDPASFRDAVEFDHAIRQDHRLTQKLRATCYLHRSCRPLDEAIHEPTPWGDGWENECEGMCGV